MRAKLFILASIFFLSIIAFSQDETIEEMVPEISIAVEVEAEKEKPAEVEEVPVEKIEKMVNVQTLPDVLKRTSGTTTAIGAALCASIPIVRSNDSKWTQILVEGAILSPIGRPYVLNMMPLTAVEKVEIIKGPAPPQYPGSTIGGIILLTLKSGDKYPGAGASLTIGGYGRQTYELWAGGGNEERNYFIAINKGLHSGWRQHQRKNLTETSMKLNFSLGEDSTLTVAGTSMTGLIWGYRPTGPNPKKKWEADWTIHSRSTGSITYKKRISERADYFLRIAPYAFSGHQAWKSYSETTGDVKPVFMPWRYSLWKTEFQYNLRPNPNTIWTYGIGYQRDTFRTPGQLDVQYLGNIPGYMWEKHNQTFKWVFLQNTFLTSKLTAYTLALRYDTAKPGKNIISPFFSVHIPQGENSKIRFAVTKNRRFADLHELYGVGMWVGNPNLKPETGWTYQLDWERKLSPGYDFNLSLYQTKLDNIIGADANNVYQNIGKARLRGLEVELERETSFGTWWINYTYLDAKDLVKNRPLVVVFRTSMPKNMLKAGVSLQGKQETSYDLEMIAVGPRKTDVDKPTWVGDPWNVTVPTEVGGYVLFNLKIGKKIGNDGKLTLSIENLFDKEYEDLVFYPGPGRWINLTYSQRF
ncbi:TonB-dependent receptor [bacterium]|nr:TonB-dependent receptor [bacterium]